MRGQAYSVQIGKTRLPAEPQRWVAWRMMPDGRDWGGDGAVIQELKRFTDISAGIGMGEKGGGVGEVRRVSGKGC